MKDHQLSRDGRFRWSAPRASWVPVEPVRDEIQTSLPMSPESVPDRPHAHCGLDCIECWNHSVRMADYIKNRNLWHNGGL